MALNNILRDEQITLMQLAAATDAADADAHRHALGRIAGRLSLLDYPHRPYVPGKSPLSAFGSWSARAAAATVQPKGGL
ncbi:MAG: hypothetical protein WC816_12455 [Sphingomonas sp.]|jgi:hypothetical protein